MEQGNALKSQEKQQSEQGTKEIKLQNQDALTSSPLTSWKGDSRQSPPPPFLPLPSPPQPTLFKPLKFKCGKLCPISFSVAAFRTFPTAKGRLLWRTDKQGTLSSSPFCFVSGLSYIRLLSINPTKGAREQKLILRITRLHTCVMLQFNNCRKITYLAERYSSSTYSDYLVFRYRIPDRFGLWHGSFNPSFPTAGCYRHQKTGPLLPELQETPAVRLGRYPEHRPAQMSRVFL